MSSGTIGQRSGFLSSRRGPAARVPQHLDPVRAVLRLLGPLTTMLVAGWYALRYPFERYSALLHTEFDFTEKQGATLTVPYFLALGEVIDRAGVGGRRVAAAGEHGGAEKNHCEAASAPYWDGPKATRLR